MEVVLDEIRGLIQKGFKEVVLTGINIGDYDGSDGSCRLAELIRAVDALDGLERVRVSSIDPDEVDDELTDAIINGKKTCHSMHIVLQSGSNAVLKRMNRKYTKQMFFDTYHRLKSHCRDFTLTTDVIVGFPGETDQDFEDTVDIIRDVEFAKVHMFPYSKRPRTRAALYKNPVAAPVIKQRKLKLLRLAEQTGYKLRQRYIGRTMKVLLEGAEDSDSSFISGHTENFLRVSIPRGNFQPNQIIDVLLTENTPEGLLGEAFLCASI